MVEIHLAALAFVAQAFEIVKVPGKEFTTNLNTRYLVSASYEFLKGQQVG